MIITIMKTKNLLKAVFLYSLLMFVSCSTLANNISVTNFSLMGQNIANHYTMVKFDISWENSWRTSSVPNNWDAAWVFVKYRIGSGAWQHAWLNNTGHLNPAGCTITTGLLDPALPFNTTTNPGLGAFIYRDANGTGTFSKTGVQLRWNYGANGVNDNAIVDIRIYAIEHVYIPQGSFYAGSGGYYEGCTFYKYPTVTNPYQITGEDPIPVGTVANYLCYNTPGGGDLLGPIPSAFPKGFNAFYCMKYEISQQEYVDFLNNLSTSQASNRHEPSYGNGYRYGITVSGGIYNTTKPFVACNYLSWPDLMAYLDWSGLRPMTELEFEKSCRGTLSPVPYEYAWGTAGVALLEYTLNNTGANNENIATNYSSTVGNSANWETVRSTGINGPLRVGIFAGNINNTGRISSGATYYGIMEMSGNLWERTVVVGSATGRAFTNTYGNGLLDVNGNHNVSTWPGTTGTGVRGGSWNWLEDFSRVSDRSSWYYLNDTRAPDSGGRGVRLAP